MKRKVLISVLAIFLCLTLVGCGKKDETKGDNNGNNNGSGEKQATSKAPENGTKHEYFYDDGVLYQIVDEEGNPKQTDFVIDGIILIGNRHGYDNITDTEAVIAKLVSEGYKKEGIISSFYLNEHIEVYLDTKYNGNTENVRMLVVPHKTIEEYEKMSNSDLEVLATEKGFVMNYAKPDEDEYKFVNSGYVNGDYPAGKYEMLFTYKGKIAYYIPMNLTKEPA